MEFRNNAKLRLRTAVVPRRLTSVEPATSKDALHTPLSGDRQITLVLETTMGFFANLYLVDVTAEEGELRIATSVLGKNLRADKAYFCWGPGQRAEGLLSYANGSIWSDTELQRLPGYPSVATQILDGSDCRVEASFTPKEPTDPVLFHFLLPPGFIPARDREIVQPRPPFVYVFDGRIVATYPVVGPGEIRYWIKQLAEGESRDDYVVNGLLHPSETRPADIGLEFNFGLFKVKVA